MQASHWKPRWQGRLRRGGRGRLAHRSRRGGFTLVELLVAMAVTLILIFALAQAFALVGNVVAEGRAAIEMAGSLRGVANRLQQDLDGLTVPARPWADEAAGAGYLELIDGPSSDSYWDDNGVIVTDPTVSNTTYGDVDDAIAFTARSLGTPFVGERTTIDALGNTITVPIQSNLAEIVWWVQFEDLPDNATGNGIYDAGEPFTIYRRAMVIRPDLGIVWDKTGANAYANPGDLGQLRNDLIWFFEHNDLSVRINWWINAGAVNVQLIANSLADLTRRENRFAHMRILSDRASAAPFLSIVPVAADAPWWALQGRVFPYAIDLNRRSVTSLYRAPKTGENAGEDVMLVNALAFDVRVFDPEAALLKSGNDGEALGPGDPAYFNGHATPINTWPPAAGNNTGDRIGYGAFVDLGYGHGNGSGTGRLIFDSPGVAASSLFSGAPQARSGMNAGVNWRTPTYCYDTWSMHYERNGVNEDQATDGVPNLIDEGTNGFDDDGNNGVDDVGERETSPPYPVPLRGLRVTIRGIEPDTRQVKQVSVISDFIPE